jgi:signal transduction histidine kinase
MRGVHAHYARCLPGTFASKSLDNPIGLWTPTDLPATGFVIIKGLGSPLNFVPKMPTAGALQETLSGLAAPAIVLDAHAGILMAANAAGLQLWGGDPESLPVIVLDRAMPALTRLRASNEQDGQTGQEPLAFWTPRGLLCSPCSAKHLPPSFGAAAFLVVWEQAVAEGAVDAPAPTRAPDNSRASLNIPAAEANSLGLIARRIREKSLTQANSAGAARPAAVAAPRREGDALANLAHELRTPLAAVIALAEIMTEEHLGPLPNERYRGYLRDIRDSARHGLALVDGLLQRDGEADGEIEPICSEVDLNETARSCLATMQPLASKAEITLSTSLDENLPRVVADARCVKQILLNLLSNSVKYAGRGANVTVRTAYELAGRAWIEVADNGPGIAPEIAASALDHVPRPAAAGSHASSGLGLPLSRRLARANGARLEIESGAANGTLVRVVFAKDRIVPV